MKERIHRLFSGLSLRYKQALVVITTSVICILFSSTTFFINDFIFMKKNFQREINVLMDMTRINSVAPMYFEDSEAAEEMLSSLKAEQDIMAAALYTPDGALFASYQRKEDDGNRPTFPEMSWLNPGRNLEELRENHTCDIVFEGAVIGHLHFLTDLTRYNRLLAWYTSLSIFIIIVSVLIAVFMSTYLRKLVVGPVLHLARVVKTISQQKNFSVRADAFYEDEIGDLILGFNEMIRKIQLRDHQLEAHRRNLEKNIRERTIDLVRVSQQLTRLNQELETEKKKAEEANSAKSNFLASMSHELKTPLNGILGYTQLLRRFSSNADGEERQRIEVIHQCAEHLLDMINEILDMSRVEAGKIEINKRGFNLISFIHTTAAVFRARAREKGLAIAVHCQKDLATFVSGDDQRIRQVLLNLLSNALKFTDQGEITLRVGTLENGLIRFEVGDSGTGIPQQNLENIFKAFTQIGDIHHKSAGTGLGLAISKQLVTLMDGQIHVESKVGRGSRFWFDLPLAPQTHGEDCMTPHEPNGAIKGYIRKDGIQKAYRVLVVDDIPDNRSLLTDLLGHMGFETREACDGKKAVEICGNHKFDLILMDLVMPVMDGIEACREIRSRSGVSPPLIIAVSASRNTIMEKNAIDAGCASLVHKPIQVEDLLITLKTSLNLEWDMGGRHNQGRDLDPAPLPDDMAAEVRAMAENGDITAILSWCRKMIEAGSDHEIFIRRIERLAGQFKVNDIKSAVAPKAEEKR